MRPEPRRLRDHHGIHIDDLVAVFLHHPAYFLEQQEAGDVLVAGIGAGEIGPHVSLAHRAEHGVADSVDEGIGVGMAHQPLGVGNFDASQD